MQQVFAVGWNVSKEKPQTRVWFVSEVFHPENEGAAYYLTEIACAAAESSPTFALCAAPTYSQKGRCVPKVETYRNVQIRRCFTTTWNRHRMSGRLVNAATFCLSVFLCLLLSLRRGDHVVCACYPPPIAFFTAVASKLRRARHILLIMDIHPDISVASGVFSATSMPIRIADRVNKWLFRSAAKTIVIGSDMKVYLGRKHSVPKEKIASIPLFVDTNIIQPMSRCCNPLLVEHGLADKFVIGIAGNIGEVHDTTTLFQVAQQAVDLPQLRFLAIGSGKGFSRLREQVRQSGLQNFVFIDRLPRSEACTIANACDVAISALYIPGLFGLACPSRTGSILAAGKPTIALIDPGTELGSLIEKHDIGWRVNPGDQFEMLEAVRNSYQLYQEARAWQEMSERARAVAVKYMQPRALLARYVAEIADCNTDC